ncbi:MAG: hypothetical protein ABRQ37_25175 [Candidatus Eremiobacterota bacterium]
MRKKSLLLCFLLLFLIADYVLADERPETTVNNFYAWYMENYDVYRDVFVEQKVNFDPELYRLLVKAFPLQPKNDCFWLDFDPFINSQMGAKSYSIGKEKMGDTKSSVVVNITNSRGGKNSVTVILRKIDGKWKISNFVYPEFELLGFLKKNMK